MGHRGSSLIECMIAVAILAIILTGVYSVALAARRMDRDANPQEQALEGIRSASAALGNYVVDWPYVRARHLAGDLTIDEFAPNGSWHLPGDKSGEYALSEGCVHDATEFLPSGLKDRQARLTYTVTTAADASARVEFQVAWP